MADLSTEYLGLKLKNPIIAGSSGLTKDINGVAKLYESGAGAIVLKSLFEEQINAEVSKKYAEDGGGYTEAYDYLNHAIKDFTLDNYLSLIEEAKDKTDIPIIASINCISDSDWVDFAKQIESAGADALELNISVLPFDPEKTGEQNEKAYFSIIDKVSKAVNLPLAIKMGSYSAGLANLIKRISWTRKVKGAVLFNRYYQPGIDLVQMNVTSTEIYSHPSEITLPLRWIGLLSDGLPMDLAGTTGVHSGRDVVKMILVGAKAVQIASVLYKNGATYIQTMLEEIERWMYENEYAGIESFRGELCKQNMATPAYERIQFMKYYGGIE